VAEYVCALTEEQAREIGKAAYRRVIAEHTYAHRAEQLEKILDAKRKKTDRVPAAPIARPQWQTL